MSDITSACNKLAPLVKSTEPEDWPVLHVPLHANTFPLAYAYALQLLRKVGSAPPPPPCSGCTSPPPPCSPVPARSSPKDLPEILKKKVRTEEWGRDPPKLDMKARFNIFFANEKQTKRWQSSLSFQRFHIFDYSHKFVLVGDATTYPSIKEWVKSISTPTVEEIRVVTDIEAEATALRNEIYVAFAETNKVPPVNGIQIVRSDERAPWDVFQWEFIDDPAKRVVRVLFFGTPLCEVLRAKDTYKSVTVGLEKVPTYLCIHASDPADAYSPVLPIWEFFNELNYPQDPVRATPALKSMKDVATSFRRCMETRLPGIDGSKFAEQFSSSIAEHCTLVSNSGLFK